MLRGCRHLNLGRLGNLSLYDRRPLVPKSDKRLSEIPCIPGAAGRTRHPLHIDIIIYEARCSVRPKSFRMCRAGLERCVSLSRPLDIQNDLACEHEQRTTSLGKIPAQSCHGPSICLNVTSTKSAGCWLVDFTRKSSGAGMDSYLITAPLTKDLTRR
jgi:hypothetical protein